jgi:hypothetical protein
MNQASSEFWRPVEGTDRRYQVSSFGNVSGPRGPLKPTLMAIGYYSVALSLGPGVVRRVYVHKLVADAFLGPGPGLVVDHVNGDKLDNRLTNLEWVTRATNGRRWAGTGMGDAGRKRTGLCGRGHRLEPQSTRCRECVRIRLAGMVFVPPNDTEWRESPVPGYRVSADGRVWSDKQYRVLRPATNKPGYQFVNLRRDGKQEPWSVSRLVAFAFHGGIPDGLVVDHINGDKSDNRAENLRVIDRSANTSHFRRQRKADGLHGAKFTEAEIREIRALLKEGKLIRAEIQARFGMSKSYLAAVAAGKVWRHAL